MDQSLPAHLAATIQGLPAEEFWIAFAIVSAAALFGFWLWHRSLKRARLIEDTPTSKCRSAAQGYVEIIGTQALLPGDPIRAPLTGRRCTWWEFCVEEKRTTYERGRTRTRWVTIERGRSDSLFLIRDDTGEAIINPEGADVTPSGSDSWYGNSRHVTGLAQSRGLFGGRYRFTEKRMHEGDPLYAIGWFASYSQQTSIDRERETAELLAHWKRDQATLLRRFDADGNGAIDMAEWENARNAARLEVEAQFRKRLLSPELHVLSRPTDGRPFILSVLPETHLTRRFRCFALAGLLLFLSAGTVGVFAFTARFSS